MALALGQEKDPYMLLTAIKDRSMIGYELRFGVSFNNQGCGRFEVLSQGLGLKFRLGLRGEVELGVRVMTKSPMTPILTWYSNYRPT